MRLLNSCFTHRLFCPAHRPRPDQRELAAELYVTPSTARTHLANVQRKLTARNRVEIAARAWENGVCAGG